MYPSSAPSVHPSPYVRSACSLGPFGPRSVCPTTHPPPSPNRPSVHRFRVFGVTPAHPPGRGQRCRLPVGDRGKDDPLRLLVDPPTPRVVLEWTSTESTVPRVMDGGSRRRVLRKIGLQVSTEDPKGHDFTFSGRTRRKQTKQKIVKTTLYYVAGVLSE